MNKSTDHLAIIAIIVILAAVAFVMFCRDSAQDDYYDVWVIHSHEPTYEQYTEYNDALERNLTKSGINARLHYNYLCCNRHIASAEDSICNRWIDSIAATGNWPDLIITTEDQATYALLSTMRPELKQCPILFGGVRFPNYPLLAKYHNVTGVRDTVDFCANMEVMKELTGNRHAYTNLDRRFFDNKAYELITNQIKGKPIVNNLDWTYRLGEISKLPADSMSVTSISMRHLNENTNRDVELAERITKGNENFFMMLGPQGLMNNINLKFDATTHSITTMSLRPQFSGINNLFGTQNCAILAGYFSSIDTWASEQSEMAAKLLHGMPASQLPIQISAKDYYLDWRTAQKFNISLGEIPSRYHIVNIPFKSLHPDWFWGMTISGSLIIVLALALSISAARNATKKKLRAYKELRENKLTFDLMHSFTQSFVWRTIDKTVTFDDSFWIFLKQKPHLITSEQFMLNWVHPDFFDAYRREILHANTTDYKSVQLKCDFEGNGNFNWWEVRIKGEYDENKHYLTFGLLLNIDDIKEREQELILARKRMEEADLKESFLANMSHEIRTPLNAIVGFSNILASPDDFLKPEEKEEYFEIIQQNNDLLLKLVNDILDISRIESGYMEFKFEQIDITSFMDGIEQSFSVQAPKHLQFIYRPGHKDIRLFIDTARAHQVMMNFLTNAAKFTPKGSITLGWEYHYDCKEVELFVEDTGIGLSDDDCILIFNRFFKKNEFMQGTGLGLSICRVIAERLRGRLTVKSKINQGSRFSLWLKPV